MTLNIRNLHIYKLKSYSNRSISPHCDALSMTQRLTAKVLVLQQKHWKGYICRAARRARQSTNEPSNPRKCSRTTSCYSTHWNTTGPILLNIWHLSYSLESSAIPYCHKLLAEKSWNSHDLIGWERSLTKINLRTSLSDSMPPWPIQQPFLTSRWFISTTVKPRSCSSRAKPDLSVWLFNPFILSVKTK